MLYYSFFILFIGALSVTIVTDALYMLIYRQVTLFLIPIFLFGASLNATPVTFMSSLLGMITGYAVLWLFKTAYTWYRGVDGIGQGDLELLALIGSFLGPIGALQSLAFGSYIGSLFALMLIVTKKAAAQTALPFGVFLGAGCFVYLIAMLNHLL